MGILDLLYWKKDSLKMKIQNIKKDFEIIVLKFCSEKFSVLHYGEYRINPKHLVFWITVETDKMKSKLIENKVLNNELRNVLVQNHYPEEALYDIHIGFESQETVDRESNGDWYLHFK
jgi:hypothetical protein